MKALITGGSRGIGYAIARQLLADKHEVLVVSKERKNILNAQKLLKQQTGREPLAHACDLSSVTNIRKLKRYSDKQNFKPDILVLNAGIFLEGLLADGKREAFLETLHVNLVSLFDVVQTFFVDLRLSSYPRIILIGSTASMEAYAFGPFYGVAKYGVRGLAINLRNEFKKNGIGVTLVTPGGTLTDLWKGEDLPPKRLLEPEDIAKVIAALLTLSEQAVVEEVVIRPMLGDMHE